MWATVTFTAHLSGQDTPALLETLLPNLRHQETSCSVMGRWLSSILGNVFKLAQHRKPKLELTCFLLPLGIHLKHGNSNTLKYCKVHGMADAECLAAEHFRKSTATLLF